MFMARADWSLLTSFLRGSDDVGTVTLSWDELRDIVGSVPDSAVDHYPQWWHGDRSHTRAWRAGGFEIGVVHPGRRVTFRRRPAEAPHGEQTPREAVASAQQVPSEPLRTAAAVLDSVDPRAALVIVPCSASKTIGGTEPSNGVGQPMWPSELRVARDRVRSAAGVDDSQLLPADRRYTGNFYSESREAVGEAATRGQLLILSGGYGLLGGEEPIGWYERALDLRDWPRGLLERLIADRARRDRRDVVCFAARTTAYARLLGRVKWSLPDGKHAILATVVGIRGTSEVSRQLGLAFAAWWNRTPQRYPAGLDVRQLG
jgi:hypothetical protein